MIITKSTVVITNLYQCSQKFVEILRTFYNYIQMGEYNEHDNDNVSVDEFFGRSANNRIIPWDETTEGILVSWADQAQCYTWLCYRAHLRYSRLQACFSIPTIIFSTVIGAASFTNISGSFTQYLPLVIGSVNISIGILTTIQQYFKISEYNENFRICSRAWDKYARKIELELTRDPCTREAAGLFLKRASEDFERLMETTPSLPIDIVQAFETKFKHEDGVQKPRLLYGIRPTEGTRNNWYRKENKQINDKHEPNLENLASQKKLLNKIQQKETNSLSNKINKFKQKEYIDHFKNLYNREPTKEEMVEWSIDLSDDLL